MNDRTAAVVGAGIGGLATAIALRQAGWKVVVHEAADAVDPVGAGISIWPNGVRALRDLGLHALVDNAPRPDTAVRRSDGSPLAAMQSSLLEARYGEPLIGLHRADLHGALLAGLGDGHLRLGARATGVTEGVLQFEDGSTVGADLIVGADGVHSIVRQVLHGDGDLRDSGLVAIRGVADFDGALAEGEWWGPRGSFGAMAIGGGRVYWFISYRGEPTLGALERYLPDFGPQARELAAHTPEKRLLVHRLLDRPPRQRWSGGNATLLGDAAHPMLPFLGQGACSALEDAVALGRALRDAPTVSDALARYERDRVKPTAALVNGSRRMARLIFLKPQLAKRVRNVTVSLVPTSLQFRQLDPFLADPQASGRHRRGPNGDQTESN